MTDNTRRVVVTGLGLVTPVGSSLDKAWNNIKNGVYSDYHCFRPMKEYEEVNNFIFDLL